MKNILYIISALILFAFVGCKKDSNNAGISKYTVYTAGYIWNNINSPCYWKNNNRIDLPGGEGAFTSSIFVYEDTVYTAGYYYNYNSHGGQGPCYWRGTTKIDLPYDSTGSDYTTSIFVSKGIIYIAGHSCYWVNSVRKTFKDSINGAFLKSMCVVDTTVYFAGYRLSQLDNTIPCYWTGNKRTDLPVDNATCGSANSIFVSDSTVYTCGYYGDGINFRACYWTGTVKTDLDGGSASYICLDAGTVYASGINIQGNPCFWKNTIRTDLALKGYASFGIDIASYCVKGGTVFTAGRYYKPNPNSDDDVAVPCYWIGNSRTDLPVIVDHYHNSTTSIFIE